MKPDSAKEAELEPKIDYRIQGIHHESVEQEDEACRKIVNLVHVVQTNPYKESLDRCDNKIPTTHYVKHLRI